MANEITSTLLKSNGGMVASTLAALIVEQLWDPTDLRAVMSFVPFNGAGSNVMDVTQDAVPSAFAAASSETTGGQSNTAYTTSKFSLTPARYVIQYQLTDMLPIAGGPIDIERVALKISQGVGLTMTDLLCALFPSLANDVGPGSGNDLTVDDLYAAQFQLNSSNVMSTPEMPYSAVLHNVQMNDFRTSLRSETGAQQFQDATAEALATKGPGFQGSWNGIDFWQSDSVETVNGGADRSGAMFGGGCFAYTLADVRAFQPHVPADGVFILTDQLLVEINRDATNGMSELIGNLYPSVVEAEDLRGVEIISDA